MNITADGSVKKKHSTVSDTFFRQRPWHWTCAGTRWQTLDRRTKLRKEQERVDKLVKKYSNEKHAEKAEQDMERQLDAFLKAQRFSNGHREQRDGRSIVGLRFIGRSEFSSAKTGGAGDAVVWLGGFGWMKNWGCCRR